MRTTTPTRATPTPLTTRLHATLAARAAKRTLLYTPTPTGVDLSSNDYLSLAHEPPHLPPLPTSSTGSRILTGSHALISQLEETAASHHDAPAALLFNSGYDANLGLTSCLLSRDDVFVHDEHVHASMHDGMRLSRSKHAPESFRHNCVHALERAVRNVARRACGNVVVCVDAVYGMQGDVAPLRKMLSLCEMLSGETGRDVMLIVDEAHSGGIYGANGEGLAYALGVHRHRRLLARVVTFGKAFAAQGAVVLCEGVLREFLVNYARPFVFSTAMAPVMVAVLLKRYEWMGSEEGRRRREVLWERVEMMREAVQRVGWVEGGDSPIFVVRGRARELSAFLRERGWGVWAVWKPAVGGEICRIVVHAGNGGGEIRGVVEAIREFWKGGGG